MTLHDHRKHILTIGHLTGPYLGPFLALKIIITIQKWKKKKKKKKKKENSFSKKLIFLVVKC